MTELSDKAKEVLLDLKLHIFAEGSHFFYMPKDSEGRRVAKELVRGGHIKRVRSRILGILPNCFGRRYYRLDAEIVY